MGKFKTFSNKHISTYVAKKPNAQGYIDYSDDENQMWSELYNAQCKIIKDHVCPHFIHGLNLLELPHDRIPQCEEISRVLRRTTGFEVEPVDALIPDDLFFKLLNERKFPAATFIRRKDELKYLQEPDLFHEYFGHCPMLTDSAYADFSQAYGELALKANSIERELLARLYWFTIEFGLLETANGFLAYGGGIISSPGELIYATTSNIPVRKPLTLLDALRTPYRIDQYQTLYYSISNYQDLYKLFDNSMHEHLAQAQQLGDFEPTFPTEDLL